MADRRKMSEIIKELAGEILREPDAVSSEAMHAALLLAHVAWNRTLGERVKKSQYRKVLREFERSKPDLWSELTGDRVEGMIETLVQVKKRRYPRDDRVIHLCGMREGNVHVEWFEGKDVCDAERIAQENLGRFLGLVFDGQDEEAVRHICATTGLDRPQVERIVRELRCRLAGAPDE